jgi:predicted  nucleic acid-binding Zn-ribbon protein
MAFASRMTSFVLLCIVMGTQGADVTPMEKVITLLKSLSQKVATEGKFEAAEYDKYACFCHDEATTKLEAIGKSNDRIDSLSAQIRELDTANTEHNSDIGDLSRDISRRESDINRITRTRKRAHDEYAIEADELNRAIDACSAAVEALRNSKTAMKGAKVTNLAQVQKATETLVNTVQNKPSLNVAPNAMALLSELKGAKGAPKFQYQSNEIIATIEDLKATFKSMKKDLDMEEFSDNSDFEKERQGLANSKMFAERKRSELEAIVESKNEQVNQARNDRDAELQDRDADQTFLDELSKDCNEKAKNFDQRSQMRSDEMKALNEATEELQTNAMPNEQGLSDVQVHAKGSEKSATDGGLKKARIRPVSFLQVNSEEQREASGKQVAVAKVISLLKLAAARTGSSILTSAAVRTKTAEDHFVKVRTLIKNLLVKLQDDANSEATQKGICDSGMSKALSDRDDANARIEAANAKITTYTANQATLEEDIRTLQKDISDLTKAVFETTELRADEKAALARVEGMSDEAIQSVKLALSILQKFYGNAFVQTGVTDKYVPANADRHGNTFDSKAPKVFGSTYHASQQESKGIIGILDVIVTDYERIKQKAEADDRASKAAFKELKNPLTGDIGLKEKEIKRKESQVTDTKANILDQQQALSDAQDLLQGAEEELENLQAMCVKGAETWEERKKAREDEIQALKDAIDILNNWQSL